MHTAVTQEVANVMCVYIYIYIRLCEESISTHLPVKGTVEFCTEGKHHDTGFSRYDTVFGQILKIFVPLLWYSTGCFLVNLTCSQHCASRGPERCLLGSACKYCQ
jgi:hypothetical protein